MIRSLIRIFSFFLICTNAFANLDSCKSIYQNCFENIPKDMITTYQELNTYGIINKNNINMRDIPLISSNNSKVLKKKKMKEF